MCETPSVVCLFRDKSENHVTQVGGITFCVSVGRGGGSSVGAESGLSGETEERTWVIKRCVEKAMEVAESRRGYAYGAAWENRLRYYILLSRFRRIWCRMPEPVFGSHIRVVN